MADSICGYFAFGIHIRNYLINVKRCYIVGEIYAIINKIYNLMENFRNPKEEFEDLY